MHYIKVLSLRTLYRHLIYKLAKQLVKFASKNKTENES